MIHLNMFPPPIHTHIQTHTVTSWTNILLALYIFRLFLSSFQYYRVTCTWLPPWGMTVHSTLECRELGKNSGEAKGEACQDKTPSPAPPVGWVMLWGRAVQGIRCLDYNVRAPEDEPLTKLRQQTRNQSQGVTSSNNNGRGWGGL